MAHALTWNGRTRAANEPLLQAFVASVLVHLLVFGTIEVGYRFDLWRHSPLALLSQWLRPKLAASAAAQANRAKPVSPAAREPREVPVIFVDVDPAQASAELPEQTAYYSAINSKAANPDTSRDLADPELEGRQNVVLKTMDSDRAKPAEAPPSAPVVAQPIDNGEDLEIAKPRETVAIGAPPLEQPKPKPTVEEPRPELKPGDLEMGKPGPEVLQPPLLASAPNIATVANPPKPRPRTIAAARAQMDHNPMSALVGEKMAQRGGVKRFSIQSSLEVRASPLGNYDARFVAAVQQCWYALLEEQHYSLDRMGKVILDFRLTVDGRITNMRVVESSVGDIYTTICQLAVTKPSPYERWPGDVRREVGADHRDVRFTFFY